MNAEVESATLVKRERCPGCGARSFHTIASEPLSGPTLGKYIASQYEGRAQGAVLQHRYELARCDSCGLAFQVQVPGPQVLHDIYERWIQPGERERLHSQYALTDYTYLSEQVQLLIQMLGMNPHAIHVLDFGMGWSEWASMARAFGCHVSGAELSQARIDHARALGFEIVHWDQIPSRGFHFINTEQVFEHLIEPLETLKHLSRALLPGGVIKVSVPNARAAVKALATGAQISALSAHDLMTVAPLEHVNSFEFESLRRMGEEAGLQLRQPKIRQIYNASSGWLQPRHALRLLARPVYRHWYPKSTIAYFAKARA